jgi:aspartate/methionine/tyrosine aminotransferase
MANWYLEKFKVELDATKEILPLIGSKEGIMHISMSFLNPGDQVLVPNPGYPAYKATALLAGAEVVNYELKETNNYQPDIDALEALDLSKVRIMWINYPHMPTGAPPQVATFKALIQFAKRNEILLVQDNPYSFILNDQPMSILAFEGAKEVALELNSLSKSHNMAGWRIGMLSGAEAYIQTVLKFKSNMDSGMYLPLQKAAVKALSLGQDWYDGMNDVYEKRRKHVYTLMDALDCIYKTNAVGMFVWARIPTSYKDGFELSDLILNNTGVFVTPGGIFGDEGDQYIRISLCNSIEVFESAIDKINIFKSKVLAER